jgi:hypothetical protein
MIPRSSLSEAGGLALSSLAAYPTRATASGISYGPSLVGAFGPVDVHKGLLELAGHGLASEQVGRWTLTPLGRELTGSERAALADR